LDVRAGREIYEANDNDYWRSDCFDIHKSSASYEHLSDINSIFRDIAQNYIFRIFLELYRGDKKKITQYFYGTAECDHHYIKINAICNRIDIEFCSAFTIYSLFQSKKFIEYVYKNKVSNESSSYQRLFFKMLFSEPKNRYLVEDSYFNPARSPFYELMSHESSIKLFELTLKYKLNILFEKNTHFYNDSHINQHALIHLWKYTSEGSHPIPPGITSMQLVTPLPEVEGFWFKVKTFLNLVRIYKSMDWECVIDIIKKSYFIIHDAHYSDDEHNIDNFLVLRKLDIINIIKDIFYIESKHLCLPTDSSFTDSRHFYKDYIYESKELILFLYINKIFPYDCINKHNYDHFLPIDPVSHLSLNTKSIADEIVSNTNSKHWLPNKLRRSKSFWIEFKEYLCKESKYFRENQKFIYYHIFENINHHLKLDIELYLNALKEDITLIKKISHRGIEKLDLSSLNASQKKYAFNYFQNSKFYKDKPLLEQALLKRHMLL
jgi:hypothetical protein